MSDLIRSIITLLLTFINSISMAQTKFSIQTDVQHPREDVWETITDFRSYPNWNSMLIMKENDQLEIDRKFHVTIINEKGKASSFKAKTLSCVPNHSFSARQTILGKWLFSATHHFILEELDDRGVRFTQTWELTGIMSRLFRKQIFEQLALFNQMNEDLKSHLNEARIVLN